MLRILVDRATFRDRAPTYFGGVKQLAEIRFLET